MVTVLKLREWTCKSFILQELARPDGTWHYSKSDSESSVKAAGLFPPFSFPTTAIVLQLFWQSQNVCMIACVYASNLYAIQKQADTYQDVGSVFRICFWNCCRCCRAYWLRRSSRCMAPLFWVFSIEMLEYQDVPDEGDNNALFSIYSRILF